MKKTDKLKKMSVLVIDDNIGDFVLVENYLIEKFEEIEITHCVNYFDAITYLQNSPLNLTIILLDLILPDAQGIELVKEILNHSNAVPVIVLSGYADNAIAKKSIELGVHSFLLKDEVTPEILKESITFAIHNRNSI
jgi:DNA-binding NarL/FixJ family response regulator